MKQVKWEPKQVSVTEHSAEKNESLKIWKQDQSKIQELTFRIVS